MAVEMNVRPFALSELRGRIEQLEQQADALRSGLDEIVTLLEWATQRSIPASALLKIPVTPQEIAAQRSWDGQTLPDELVRLYLQAHTLATRLKYLVPSSEKQAIVNAVVETFHKMAEAQQFSIPVEMEVTVGD